MGGLRSVAAPFVASGPSGVAVRTRLKQLTPDDEKVLRLVGGHLGSLASKDLKARCRDGLSHSGEGWAVRERELTPLSSSRWAGSITKSSHDQWALARRCQLAHIQNLETGVRTIEDRLALPVGQKGTKKAPGDGRHRPHSTGVMRWGIGPSRPDQDSLGVREPAPASPDHGHDPSAPDAERTRNERGQPERPTPSGAFSRA